MSEKATTTEAQVSAAPSTKAAPITYEEIAELVKNYRDKMPAGDSHSAWVNLKEIYALLADNPGATGIRIYFGRHKNDPDYKDQNTVILVATEDTDNQYKPTPEYSKDLLQKGLPKPLPGSVVYSGMGDDRIPLCPPRCPKNDNDYISDAYLATL